MFLPSGDVTFADATSPPALDGIASSRNLLVLVGKVLDKNQFRDVERFLRQTLDEGSSRLVIPVQASGTHTRDLPSILSHFKAERLRDDDDEAITTLSHRVSSAVSTARAPLASGTMSNVVREDALDTLSDVTGWRLDSLRWLLVEQGVGALEQALKRTDENALRVVTSDLELLGPVRSSGIGSSDAVDMPLDLRDRVTALINRLGG